ncbi:MAG: SET domain-containing protein [Pseudolabrys sp.]|jgi:SET domain-containing protein
MPPRPFRVGRALTGLGLFATRPIKKKTRIAEYKGPILDAEAAERAERRGNRYLYEVSKNRTIDGTARSNVARYANHSCNPNAESVIWRGRVFIKALRDIKPGEEIVYDYGTDYLKNVIGRSKCKCSRCRRRRARRARELREQRKRRAARAARQGKAGRTSKRKAGRRAAR